MNMNNISESQNHKPSGFQVPEGYFESFTERMMAQLPDKKEEEVYAPTLWQRIRPWAYMAAMFMGISLMVRLFTGLGSASDSVDLSSPDSTLSMEMVNEAMSEDDELMRYVYCTTFISDYSMYTEYIDPE